MTLCTLLTADLPGGLIQYTTGLPPSNHNSVPLVQDLHCTLCPWLIWVQRGGGSCAKNLPCVQVY